jgi:hypothetical protein
VAGLADSSSATDWSGTAPDTALPLNGVTYQAAGPLGSQAITTDGSTGWAETTVKYTDPTPLTILAWFKTSSDQGAIVGFGNNQTTPTSDTDSDRMIWVDSTGHLVWAVYSSAVKEVTSTSTYANGSWNFVAASIGSAGMQLYVNGSLQASASTPTAAMNFSGWWSFGYAGSASKSWTDAPASYYFNGSIAQVAVIPSQLTSAQVTTLEGDNTLSSYSAGVKALSPANYWQFNDSGSVPYDGTVPGGTASTKLADASGNANSGTAESGTTLGVGGPTSLGGSAISLNGSTGYVETTKSYVNPSGISEMAWFETSSSSGGSVMGLTDAKTDTATSDWDRTIWVDNSGHVVYEVWNGAAQELTSANTYNNGQWHFVVAEIGAAGEQLWVDGAEVGVNTAITSTNSYTGYWHLGWGDTVNYTDPPTDDFFTGLLAQAAIVPTQLSASQISTLYSAGNAAAFELDMAQLTPTSYWPLNDSASGICGTTEITVQQTVGSTNTCIYPSAAGTCAVPSSTYLLTLLGAHTMTAPTAASPVTITITMELTATPPAGELGLHEIANFSFGTALSSMSWSAQIAYPYAWSVL